MSLPTPSSRHRRSLSSLLSWNRYNSIPPILFAGDEDHFQRERHRELQFTLDKLEGRIRVTPEGHFRRVGFEDPTLDDVCGLMSMLGDNLTDANDDQRVEENGFRDVDYHAISDWATGQSSTGFGDPYDGPICGDNNESDGTRWMTTGGVAVEVPKNITHPAFSWAPDTEERWETSSRVSEDSFFDEHTRFPPQPKLSVTCKAVGRLSPPGVTTTIPLYRDSLCSKILSESWPKLHTRLRSSEDVPFIDSSNFAPFEEPNEPRALSYIPPFDPCSTTLAQARHVFPGKPSFMKKMINIIAHPMKMLASRNKKPLVNISNGSGSSSGKISGNYEVASSYPSGSSRGTRKKVVFNDTVGYRVFHKDSLCAEDH